MILLTLLSACLLHFGDAPVQAIKPDANNGYEDYLRAADAMDDGNADLYYRWKTNQFEELSGKPDVPLERQTIGKQLDGLDYFGVETAFVRRYGTVLEILKAGNKKRAWYPASFAATERPPSARKLFALAELCGADAYIRFANGDSKGGAQSLLDGLTYSKNIQTGRLISLLIGIAAGEGLFARCAESLNYLGQTDAKKIASFADAAMAEAAPLSAVLEQERLAHLASLPTVLSKSGDDRTKLNDLIRRLTTDERRDAAARITDGINQSYAEMQQRLTGPESQWFVPLHRSDPVDENNIGTVDELVRYMIAAFKAPDMMRHVLLDRTQMRLLALHGRIIDYRWRYGHLPQTLGEAVPENLTKDPMTASVFSYEMGEPGKYRLFSKGLPVTGPIELGYREGPYPIGQPPAAALGVRR